MSDNTPVNFRDYDPTINPTNVITPYDPIQDTATITPGERIKDEATLTPGPSIEEEYAEKKRKDAKVPKILLDAIKIYAKAVQAARAVERVVRATQAEYLQVIQREAELDRLKSSANTPITAWCADYSTEIAGEVATLEVPGEVDPIIGGGINIRPANGATSAPWSADYGQIQLGTALSPSGFAWNFTMLMPWMKWMPKWRYATVTGKDEDANTLNVNLLPIVSKAQTYLSHDTSFNEPWEGSMSDIPVEYMGCGAGIFEVDDVVIVEFRSGGGGGLSFYDPYVIGFKQEPKECWPEMYFHVGFYSEDWVIPDGAGEPWAIITELQPPGPPSCRTLGAMKSGGAYPADSIYSTSYARIHRYDYIVNPNGKPATDISNFVYPTDDFTPQKVSAEYKSTVYIFSGSIQAIDSSNLQLYVFNTVNSSGLVVNQITWPAPYYQSTLCCDGPDGAEITFPCHYRWPTSPLPGAWVTSFVGAETIAPTTLSLISPSNTFTAENIQTGGLMQYSFDRYEFYNESIWVAIYTAIG